MYAKITNTSRATQGVHTTGGVSFIAPGASRNLTIAAHYVERVQALSFLTVEPTDLIDGNVYRGDGRSAGAPEVALTDTEEAELVGAMTDDELRDYIERKTGKKPHHKAGHDKLVAQATEAAKG